LFLLYKIPFSDKNELLPESTFIEVRLRQYPKTPFPILVTLLGMVTLVKFKQKEKA
jgi:hypothetical protein